MSARSWQEIAAEMTNEMDSVKLAALAQEMEEAFKRRDSAVAAFVREHRRENIAKRLLFVDDEDSIRATLPTILQQRGFDVLAAASVPEAIQIIQNHTFDALLSDLNIENPGDGYTVVQAIRKINPRCVAIILTGYPGFESAVQGIQEKIDDYLVKPADIDLLVACIEKRLAERNLSAPQLHLPTRPVLTGAGSEN